MMVASLLQASSANHCRMLVKVYLASTLWTEEKILEAHMIQFHKTHCKDAQCNSTMASLRRTWISPE
jgi:hypothetical protein